MKNNNPTKDLERQLSLFTDEDFEQSQENTETPQKEAKIIYMVDGLPSKYKPGTIEYLNNNPHFVQRSEIGKIANSEEAKRHFYEMLKDGLWGGVPDSRKRKYSE